MQLFCYTQVREIQMKEYVEKLCQKTYKGPFLTVPTRIVRAVATDVVFYPPEETVWPKPCWEPCCPWT